MPWQLPSLPLDVAISRAQGLRRTRRPISSWLKKRRVKWHRNLDGGTWLSSAVNCDYEQQACLFERRRSLRNPSAANTTIEVSFQKTLKFSLRGSGGSSKTKNAPLGSHGRCAFRRMFRLGEDKKGRGHQGTGSRRMPDSVVTEVARKEASSQWSSVPLEVSESPPG